MPTYQEFINSWELDPSIDHTDDYETYLVYVQECQDEMYMQEQRVLHGIS